VRPLPDGKTREFVPINSQNTIDGQLNYILTLFPQSGMLLAPAIQQYKINYMATVNQWNMAANALDHGLVSNFTKYSSLVGVFILDTMAFTFTFYGLFETLYEAQQHGKPLELRDPIPHLQLISMAAFVAAFVTLAIKKLAEGATKDKKAKVAYFAAWSLFAIADFYYLATKGVVGVGAIATGLLVVMCAITLLHAHHGPKGTDHLVDAWDRGHEDTYFYNQRLHAALVYSDRWEKVSGSKPDPLVVIAMLTNWSIVDANILKALGLSILTPTPAGQGMTTN
jgi:hypothetical protein